MTKAEALLKNTLRDGETLLWVKHKTAASRAWYWFAYYFLGLVSIFLITAIPSIASGNFETDPASLIGLVLFLSVPGVMLYFALKLLRRRKTFTYAVTDQRVIILNPVWPATVDAFGPNDLTSLFRHEDGKKSRIFLRSANIMWAFNFSQIHTPPILFDLENAREIEALIYDRLVRKQSNNSLESE